MSKPLSLILSISMLAIFTGCSKSDEDSLSGGYTQEQLDVMKKAQDQAKKVPAPSGGPAASTSDPAVQALQNFITAHPWCLIDGTDLLSKVEFLIQDQKLKVSNADGSLNTQFDGVFWDISGSNITTIKQGLGPTPAYYVKSPEQPDVLILKNSKDSTVAIPFVNCALLNAPSPVPVTPPSPDPAPLAPPAPAPVSGLQYESELRAGVWCGTLAQNAGSVKVSLVKNKSEMEIEITDSVGQKNTTTEAFDPITGDEVNGALGAVLKRVDALTQHYSDINGFEAELKLCP